MTTNNGVTIDFLKNINSPFDKKLGLRVVEVERGKAVIELNIKQEFLNSNGIIHGGLTASLCDTAMGASAMTLGVNPLTVEMKVNYLSPGGTDGKFIAVGRVIKEGRTLIFAESEIYYNDKLIAKSIGTYIVKQPRETAG